MLFAEGALGLFLMTLWLVCIFDVITTPAENVNHLPKMAWLLIVLFLPDIGSILWLIAGRDRFTGTRKPRTTADRAFPEYDRPGRAVATNPEDDEAFLRQLRERADSQRRQQQERRRAELQREDERLRRRPDERSD